MRSHFHGGHDVAGSAARALPFDRLAVGVIAATNSPEGAQAEPAGAAVMAGNDLRKPMAAASGQIVWEGDAPRETGRFSGVASCLDDEFYAKASEDNGATGKATMRRADCMAGEASRVDAGRTASATSETMDVTAGETAPNSYSPAVSCVPANLPEAAQPQAPAPAASGKPIHQPSYYLTEEAADLRIAKLLDRIAREGLRPGESVPSRLLVMADIRRGEFRSAA